MNKVYIIVCFDENECFLKIGKTKNKINQRFCGVTKMPYNLIVLKVFEFKNDSLCSSFEKQLHKKYLKYSYQPAISFSGKTECFEYKLIKKIEKEFKVNV